MESPFQGPRKAEARQRDGFWGNGKKPRVSEENFKEACEASERLFDAGV